MRIKALIVVMLILLGLSGCTTVTGNKVFLKHYQGLQKGVTPKAEVLQLLGKPGEVLRPQPAEEVLVYEQRKNRTRISFFHNDCFLDTERLSVYLNEEGVVRDYALDSLSEEIGCPSGGSTYVAASTSSTYRPNYSTPTALAPRTTSYH
mgnify:CR=1 FL=1